MRSLFFNVIQGILLGFIRASAKSGEIAAVVATTALAEGTNQITLAEGFSARTCVHPSEIAYLAHGAIATRVKI
jgi:hypothetical protein